MKRLAAMLVFVVVLGSSFGAWAEGVLGTPKATQPPQKAEWMDLVEKVKYLGDRDVSHITPDNVQRVWFSLMDENETRIAAPSIVEVKIINDNNELVYEGTHYLSPDDFGTWTNKLTNTGRLLCSFDIKDEDIRAGSSKNGIFYMTVHYSSEHYYNGLFDAISFPEWSTEVSNLPYASPSDSCTIDIPETPITVRSMSGGTVRSITRIDLIKYEFEDYGSEGEVKLSLFFTGEKTHDMEGVSKNRACQIGYKLYHEGYVIESGVLSTSVLTVGEKYKNETLTFSRLEPGKFKLQILDVE